MKNEKKHAKPNILFIMADQFRLDAVGHIGHWTKTDNLNRLADEGITFTNCVTNTPICMPARVSLATGRYPHNTGLWNNVNSFFLGKEEKTWMQEIRNNGYRTSLFGKTHLYSHLNKDHYKDLREYEDFIHAYGIDDVNETTGPRACVFCKSHMTEVWERKGYLTKFKEDMKDKEMLRSQVFYKERWIKENDLEQKLIVTYSVRYRDYLRKLRNSQIERAQKIIDERPGVIKKSGQNDYKRLIHKTNITSEGEVADKEIYSINTDLIQKEETFDGFYGVCTNLDDNVSDIIKINHRRWEIEECFRIMKSEFEARPVYLSRDERIEAHFITCFIALVIYRLLEKRLQEQFTCSEIISELREMNFMEIKGEGYVPIYTRTDFTDALHEAFGFRTDYQIITTSMMKKIFKNTKT